MYKINCHQLTSTGDKAYNQDYMLYKIDKEYGLFVLADGLGGHQAGEMAAHYFCQSFIYFAPKYAGLIRRAPKKVLTKWFAAAMKMMKEAFQGDPVAQDAYTTCAILILTDEYVISVHCGDSRVYRLNKNGIVWRTKDHSVPQKLFDAGVLDEYQMGTHPEQNKLTKCVNVASNFSPEINIFSGPKLGETFVLCSDGFWEFTKEHEFVCLANEPMQKSFLLKQAKMALFRARGNADNLTVQWVRMGE